MAFILCRTTHVHDKEMERFAISSPNLIIMMIMTGIYNAQTYLA